jgi:hypothetical protein
MGLTGLASPDTVIDMLEIFLILHGAPRAETPLFLFDTAARPFIGKAVGDLFVAVNKTRAHPAKAEPDRFFPVHNTFSRLFIAA